MSYNSKYKGAQVEAFLDKISKTNEEELATKEYVDNILGDINEALETIINK